MAAALSLSAALTAGPGPLCSEDTFAHLAGPLDIDAMSAAAKALVGKHDWTSYCSASEPPDGRVREMRSARVARHGDFVELELVAEGFLRGLARSIAGGLAEVGRGRKPPAWVGEVLAARDRRLAPPGGQPSREQRR